MISQKLIPFTVVDPETVYLSGYIGSDFSPTMEIYMYMLNTANTTIVQYSGIISGVLQSQGGTTILLGTAANFNINNGFILLLI